MKERMKERMVALNEIAGEMGYQIHFCEKVSNNITKYGYSISKMEDNKGTSVYYNPSWYEKTDLEVVNYLISCCRDDIQVSIDKYLQADYVKENVQMMILDKANLKRIQETDFVYELTEQFLVLFYVDVINDENEDYNGTMKITNQICQIAGVKKNELFSYARKNMEADLSIRTMQSVMAELLGMDFGEMEDSQDIPMYVVTNKKKFYGASAILCEKTYEILSNALGEKFIILPSSIHECIAIPYADESEQQGLIDMVMEVNATQVDIEERLSDQIYICDRTGLKVVEINQENPELSMNLNEPIFGNA